MEVGNDALFNTTTVLASTEDNAAPVIIINAHSTTRPDCSAVVHGTAHDTIFEQNPVAAGEVVVGIVNVNAFQEERISLEYTEEDATEGVNQPSPPLHI